MIEFGNVRLVGIDGRRADYAHKHDVRRSRNRPETVSALPQDIIDNTRRAFNASTTSATGYSARACRKGATAPANSADCIQLKMAIAPGHSWCALRCSRA